MKFSLRYYLPLLLFSFFHKVAGQTLPGLDPDFVISSFSGPNILGFYSDQLEATTSGKFLFSGKFSAYQGKVANGLVRLNADLSMDSSFNFQVSNGKVFGFHQLPNGKILVYGELFLESNQAPVGLVRLFQNGSIDPEFHSGSFPFGVEGKKKMAIFPNGEILFTDGQYILKFQENGLPISAFQPLTADSYTSLQPLSPNSFLVLTPSKIRKFFASGTQDTSFHCDLQPGWNSSILTHQSDSTFLITSGVIVSKINHQGTSIWTQTNASEPLVLGVDQEDRVLLYSIGYEAGTSIFRLLPNGIPDSSFTRKISDFPSIVTLHNSGFALVTANHWANYFPTGFVSKLLDANGEIVQKNRNTGLNGPIRKVLIQKDKSVLICGFFNKFNEYKSPGILRILPDGRLDSTFSSDLPEKNYPGETEIQDLSQDSTGNTYGLLSGNALKLFRNGKVDTSFHFEFPEFPAGSGQPNLINLVVGPGQKLYALTNKESVSKVSRHFLDGRLDTSFLAPDYPFQITGIFQDSDSALFIENSFAGFADLTQTIDPRINYLVRIAPNGEVLPGFNFSGRGGEIKAIKRDAMGQIYISTLQNLGTPEGSALFSSYMKIKANGVEDSVFYQKFNMSSFGGDPQDDGFMPYAFEANEGTGMLSSVLGTDGKVSIEQRCPNGLLNSSQPMPKLEMGWIYSMAFADSQSVYVAGDFLMANGQPVNRIARIKIPVCGLTDVRLATENSKSEIALYPNPGKDYFKIMVGNEPVKVTAYNLNGKEIPLHREPTDTDLYQFKVSEWPSGIYLIRIESTAETRALKWWKN